MNVAVIFYPGTSAGHETMSLFTNFASKVDRFESTDRLTEDYDLYVIPDGNAYGNAVRPGALAAYDQASSDLVALTKEGKVVLGIGNGFQILTELDLLPGNFIVNQSLNYFASQVPIVLNDVFFDTSQAVNLSVANKFANFQLTDQELADLDLDQQVLMTYQNDTTGSVKKIAGVTNKLQTVFGLMPLVDRHQDQAISSTAGLDIIKQLLTKKGLI